MEVRLYSFLRLQAGTRSVAIELAHPFPLNEVLEMIAHKHTKLGASILAADGQPAEHLVITINGTQWHRDKDALPLVQNEDVIDLILAIGGG